MAASDGDSKPRSGAIGREATGRLGWEPAASALDGTRAAWSSWISRQIVFVIGIIVFAAMFAVSGFMNFRFGMTLGVETFDKWLYGVASLTADGFKALSPILFIGLWAAFCDTRHKTKRAPPRGMLVLLMAAIFALWCLCATWSLASGVAVVGGRSDPQAETISTVLGVETSVIKTALVVLIALLIEAGSSLGLTLVVIGSGHLPVRRRPPPFQLSADQAAEMRNTIESARQARVKQQRKADVDAEVARLRAQLKQQRTEHERAYAKAVEEINGLRAAMTAPPMVETEDFRETAKRVEPPSQEPSAQEPSAQEPPPQEPPPQEPPPQELSAQEPPPQEPPPQEPPSQEAPSKGAGPATAEEPVHALAQAPQAEPRRASDEPPGTVVEAAAAEPPPPLNADLNQDPKNCRPEEESQDPVDEFAKPRVEEKPARGVTFFKLDHEKARRKLPEAEERARRERQAAERAAASPEAFPQAFPAPPPAADRSPSLGRPSTQPGAAGDADGGARALGPVDEDQDET